MGVRIPRSPLQYIGRGGRVVEGTRLLSGFSSKDGTGVRISPSPFAQAMRALITEI
jgi:hypothetical protein